MSKYRSKKDYDTESAFYFKHRGAGADLIIDERSGLIKSAVYNGPLLDYYLRNEDAYSEMTERVDAVIAKGPPALDDFNGMKELQDILGPREMDENERLYAAIEIAMTAPFPRIALRHIINTLAQKQGRT